jgi:predicted hotdog family 3-hydroxylacyl-ACP dehydratase
MATAPLIGIGALAGAVAVFAAMLRSEQGARRVGELAGRGVPGAAG